MRNWLSAHIYGHVANVLVPAADLVRDLEAQGLIRLFFFVRFGGESEPHLRLRLLPHDQARGEVRRLVEAAFAGREGVRRLEWVEYEPEVERYGGTHGIPLAEELFDASSRAALELHANGTLDSYESALGCALQMHTVFIRALGFDVLTAARFFAYVDGAWSAEVLRQTRPGGRTLDLKELHAKFRALSAGGEADVTAMIRLLWDAMEADDPFEDPWLAHWATACRRFAAGADEVTALNARQSTRAGSILESLVHMTNNRLGIHNWDEAYLGFVLTGGLRRVAENSTAAGAATS